MSRTALAVLLTAFVGTPGDQSVGPDDDYAGMVAGVITDAETQGPVSRATVGFGALGIGGMTTRDGDYLIPEVPEEGRYVMTIQHPCYLTVSVELDLSQAYEQPLTIHVGLPPKPRLTSQRFSPPLGAPCWAGERE